MITTRDTGFLIGGMALATVGAYVAAKLLRPTIREKLATIAARQLIRFSQSENIPITQLGISEQFLKTRLMYPAIDAALNEVL